MNEQSPWARAYDLLWVRGVGRVLTWVLLAPIIAYQHLLSPMLPASCRHYPSCSAYATTALRVHGPLKGTALSVARLARCNPWSAGGVNPVPSRGRWRTDVLPDGSTRSPQSNATPTTRTKAPTRPSGD